MQPILILVAGSVLDNNLRAAAPSFLQHTADGDPAASDSATDTDDSQARNLGYDLHLQLMKSVKDMLKAINSKMAEGDDAYSESASQIQQSINDVGGVVNKLGKAITTKISTISDDFDRKINSAMGKDDAHASMQRQKQEEVVNLVSQTKQSVQLLGSEVNKAISNTEKMAEKFPTEIKNAQETMQKNIDTEVDTVQANANKDTGEVKTKIGKDIQDLTKALTNAVADLKRQVDAVKTSSTGNLANLKKLQNKQVNELAAQITRLDTVIEGLGTSMTTISQAQDDAETAQDGTLQTVKGTLTNLIENTKASVDTKVKTLKLNFENQVKAAQEKFEEGKGAQIKSATAQFESQLKNMQSKFEEETKTVDADVKKVQGSVTDMGKKIDESLVQLKTTQGNVLETAKTLDTFKATQRQATEAQEQSNAESLTKINTNFESSVEQLKTTTLEQIAQVKPDIEALVDGKLANQEKAIGDVQQQIEDSGTALSSSLMASKNKAGVLLKDMKAVASDLQSEKRAVGQQVPDMAKALQKSYSDVSAKVDSVSSDLRTSRDQVLQVLTQSTQQIDEQTQKSMQGVEDHVRGQLQQSTDAAEKTMQSLMEQISALKAGSEADYEQSRQAQADLHDELSHSVQRAMDISKRSEDQGAALKANIAEAIELLKRSDNSEAHDTQALETELQQLIKTKVHAATADAGRKIKDVMDNQNAELSAFEQKAAKKLASDESLLQEYSKTSNVKLAQVSDAVKDLGFKIEKTQLAAESKNNDLIAQTKSLVEQQSALSGKYDRATQAEKEMISKRTGELEKLVQDKVGAVSAANAAQVAELKRQTRSALDAERARQELEKNKVDQTVKSWEDKLGAEITQVGDAVKNTQRGLHTFEDAQEQSESSFQQEIGKLDKDIAASEDRVDAKIKHEDAHVSGIMRGEMANMQGLVETFKGAQADAEKKVTNLKQSLAEQMQLVQSQSTAQSTALSSKLKQVEERAADLASEFRQDSKASSEEMQATQQRLDKVVNSTMLSMDGFHQQLKEVQQSRVNEAAQLRSAVDSVKQSLTQTMQATGQNIAHMKEGAEQAYKGMSDKQQELSTALLQASNDAAGKDARELQTVQQRVDALEQDHDRLDEWQRSFKHRTLAWRQEVERRLGQLPGQLGADVDLQANASLSEASSFIEEAQGSDAAALKAENQQLRAMNAELMKENEHLYEQDSLLDKRVEALEKKA